MRCSLCSLVLLLPLLSATPLSATPTPRRFDSTGEDKAAIAKLLHTYTEAVSSKNQNLFESLLLNKDIPFSEASSAIKAGVVSHGTQNYEGFRESVFEGPPFTQRFQDVHIDQDGPLAAVSLVFINESPGGSSWGWKALQLLKIKGQWKIASEFFTGHSS